LAQGFSVEMSSAASFRRSVSDAKFEPVDTGSWRVRACQAAARGNCSSG
jgi:hypothetical protein